MKQSVGVFDVVVVVLPPLEGDNQVRPSFSVATDSRLHDASIYGVSSEDYYARIKSRRSHSSLRDQENAPG